MAGLLQTSLGCNSSTFCGGRVSARPCTAQRVAAPMVGPIQAAVIGPGKKWEKLPVNEKGKVIRQKLHVKTGDYVVVIAGKDKGKTGEISKVDLKRGLVWMEGVNLKTRYNKPTSEEETGSMFEKEAPLHHSNVMHYSKEQNVRSRIGKKKVDGKKVRFLRKTGEVLPN